MPEEDGLQVSIASSNVYVAAKYPTFNIILAMKNIPCEAQTGSSLLVPSFQLAAQPWMRLILRDT